ncbi:MAG: hypothetical protein WBA51_15890 [Erythrobacter sp.]
MLHRRPAITARAITILASLGLALSLNACVARTAATIVTAPVKVASKGVDLATTSQSEADEKRGRELRKREEELGKLERKYQKQLTLCREGDRRACGQAPQTYNEIQALIRSLPAEPSQQSPAQSEDN